MTTRLGCDCVALSVLAGALVVGADGRAQEASDARAVHCMEPNTAMTMRVCSGLALVDAERWIEGEATLESALALMGPATQDPSLALMGSELESLRPLIEASLGQARAHLGGIEITCAPLAATVEVDGVVQGVAPLLRPVRVLPGAHRVRCAHTGYEGAEGFVEVSAMSIATASFTLASIDTRPPLERFGNPGDGQRIVGYIALSLGGASLAAGFGTLAGATENPPPLRDQLFDVSRATLIAGGAAVLLGVVLTLTAE